MSDYIMDLRRIVGHRPLLQAGASVLLEDARGRLQLQRRADCHLWGYHGGSVELDEVVEEAGDALDGTAVRRQIRLDFAMANGRTHSAMMLM